MNVLFVASGGWLAGAERCLLDATNAFQLGFAWGNFGLMFGAARLAEEGAED